MTTAEKLIRLSNAYYNKGLSKAGVRDLSGAAAELRTSLMFNKANTRARNLLGLICCETGEIGAALYEWVVSVNLCPENNPAERYLMAVNDARGYLERAGKAVSEYNNALTHVKKGNPEFAIMLLARNFERNPKYVRAGKLLGTLYLERREYAKAGRCFMQVLKTDRADGLALEGLKTAKTHTGKLAREEAKYERIFSHRQLTDDDVILPYAVGDSRGTRMTGTLAAGVAIGIAVAFFILFPTVRYGINVRHNEEVRQKLELLGDASVQIDSLKTELAEQTSKAQALETELAEYAGEREADSAEYAGFIAVLEAVWNQDWKTAAEEYSALDLEKISENISNTLLDSTKALVAENGLPAILSDGELALSRGDASEAERLYAEALAIDQKSQAAMYGMGMALKTQGKTEEAAEYFGNLISMFPDTEYADMAKAQRGY